MTPADIETCKLALNTAIEAEQNRCLLTLEEQQECRSKIRRFRELLDRITITPSVKPNHEGSEQGSETAGE